MALLMRGIAETNESGMGHIETGVAVSARGRAAYLLVCRVC
jgi:hypothetical protein